MLQSKVSETRRAEGRKSGSWVRSIVVLAVFVGLVNAPWAGRAAIAGDFIRGDMNGDGRIDVGDIVGLLATMTGEWTGAIVGCVGAEVESADINDNEYFTLADTLLLPGILFGPGIYAFLEPQTCGADPTTDTFGFDQQNTDYEIRASLVEKSGSAVEIQLQIKSPLDVQGVSFGINFSPNMSPVAGEEFTPAYTVLPFPEGLDVTKAEDTGNQLVVNSGSVAGFAAIIPATSGEFVDLGTLSFTLNDPNGDASFDWLPEYEVGGLEFRATVVTSLDSADPMLDHHPVFSSDERPTTEIVRGDVNGSQSVDVSDVNALLNYFLVGGDAPANCAGESDLDAGDVNDNEYITVADVLNLGDYIFGSATLPGASDTCAEDPSDDFRGFDQEDPAYVVTASEVQIFSSNLADPTKDRQVWIPVSVVTPEPIVALQLLVEYDPRALTPYDVDPLRSGFGGGYSEILEAGTGSALLLVALIPPAGTTLVPNTEGAFVNVGTLRFALKDEAVFRPLFWKSESTKGLVTYRASLVGEDYQDHHPQMRVGEFEFVRGNANSDVSVNIADAQFIFNYLFGAGIIHQSPPKCEIAMDANDDETVDISDGVWILNHLFGSGQIIYAPYPQCGLDPNGISLLTCTEAGAGNACEDTRAGS